jgi:predicted DNA-binding protein (MmcQ/YjbR family)
VSESPGAASQTTPKWSDEPRPTSQSLLSLTGAEETFPFGPLTSVFKVAGKMFALTQLGADSLRVSLKCKPVLAEPRADVLAVAVELA